jgi:hypothetical protein
VSAFYRHEDHPHIDDGWEFEEGGGWWH